VGLAFLCDFIFDSVVYECISELLILSIHFRRFETPDTFGLVATFYFGSFAQIIIIADCVSFVQSYLQHLVLQGRLICEALNM
jgi:hypothetical protein